MNICTLCFSPPPVLVAESIDFGGDESGKKGERERERARWGHRKSSSNDAERPGEGRDKKCERL